jgi:hypothetical protein
VIDLIGRVLDSQGSIRVTASVPASQGKKTDEGTMMLPSTPESNPAAVPESPETQIPTPATTKDASDILINWKIEFCGGTQKLRDFVCPATYRSLLPPAPGAVRRFGSSQHGCLCFRDVLCESCPSPAADCIDPSLE